MLEIKMVPKAVLCTTILITYNKKCMSIKRMWKLGCTHVNFGYL